MNTLFYKKRRDERKQPSLSPAVSKTSVVIFSKVALLRSEEQTKLQSWSFVDQVLSNMIGYYCLFVSVRPMCHQITVARYFTFSDNLLKISHDAQYYSLATTRSVWDVIAIAPFTCTAHSTPAQRSHQRSTATSASKWLINIIFHSLSQLFARSKSGFFKEIADPVVCECHHGLTTTVAGVSPNIWHTVKLVLIIVLEVLIWLELELRAT